MQELHRSSGARKSQIASLDRAFHLAIASITGNLVLTQLLERVMTLLDSVRPRTLALPGQAEASWEEHRRIALVVSRGDEDAARTELTRHLESVIKALTDAKDTSTEN
jgi:DNA-binding FadR family transcriptional regulator